MSDPELKEEIRRRHGVDLPDELLGVLADPREILESAPLARFLGKAARFRRPAWEPAVEAGEGARTASKYGGVPWLAAGEACPACPEGRGPLQWL